MDTTLLFFIGFILILGACHIIQKNEQVNGDTRNYEYPFSNDSNDSNDSSDYSDYSDEESIRHSEMKRIIACENHM